jgi:hypothetical protein
MFTRDFQMKSWLQQAGLGLLCAAVFVFIWASWQGSAQVASAERCTLDNIILV